MAIEALSDEALRETVAAYLASGNNQQRTADALGLARSTVQNRLQQAARKGLIAPAAPAMPGFEITRLQTGPRGTTVEQKPELGGQFEVPEGHRIKGVSAFIDPDGRLRGQWVKTREGEVDAGTLLDRLMERFSDWQPPEINIDAPAYTDADRLTVYPIADVHLGLKAFGGEAPAEYDLDKAVSRYRETTARLFDRSPNSQRCLILNIGDWTHANDATDATPAHKNKLDVSHRLLDVIVRGVELFDAQICLALTKHEIVIVKILRGNHDPDAWIALYVAMKQRFKNEPRVIIDDGQADYWFFRFGNNLIGAHHGHRLTQAEMAGAMATECREDWGETLYHWFLHGHLHHFMVKEVMGVRVECMRTIAEADGFHSGKYPSGKSMVSVTLHKDGGEEGRAIINIPPAKKRASHVGIL